MDGGERDAGRSARVSSNLEPTKPETEQSNYLLFTDASMANDGHRSSDDPPGEARIGVVLKRRKGSIVMADGWEIDPSKVQVAEYRALIKGLQAAIDRGVKRIRVFMDNELVVDQVNGKVATTSDELVLLREEVLKRAGRFPGKMGFRISWLPRELNKEADDQTR